MKFLFKVTHSVIAFLLLDVAYIEELLKSIIAMLENTSEYEIHINKRTDRIYLSKALEQTLFERDNSGDLREIKKPVRILSKVFEGLESHEFIKQGKELVLRITEGQRHELVAKFYEDTRGVFTLQIQKFSTDSGNPHKAYFTFINDEIGKLYNFIRNIALLPISGTGSNKYDDDYLKDIILSKEQALKLLLENKELVSEIIKNNISETDISAMGYRKEQLKIFKALLDDQPFFDAFKERNHLAGNEAVWQFFFEKNTWIFGYGLTYIFNSSLTDRKLEQVTSGYNAFSSGKRIDALMRSRGIISSLCFGEIKTHTSQLLDKEYRAESFAISAELSGGIAQVQKTIQKALKELSTKLDLKDNSRNPTGETVFLYQPKAFLIIGCLEEFKTEHGINEDKYSSFELFRRNITNPEIITFDELYERARYITEFSENRK
jgi:hypothetical protein